MEEQKLLKRKEKAQSEGNTTLLLSVSISLADLYFNEGRYEDAINEYNLTANIYKKQDQVLKYACANRMIGEAYTCLYEFKKALKHQEIHLVVAREHGNKLEEQRALATIGHTHLTSYLHIIDNPEKTSIILAAKNFMESLNICKSLKGSISKTEYMDILARLYSNLGVVQECKGNYGEGIDLLKKSIHICKVNDIFEQLERGYTYLGSLYGKMKDFSNAIESYSLGIKVAGRLDKKNSLICTSLASKADIYIKLANFQAAKIELLKAYKLKTPCETDGINIERNLKVVASMCYTEESLVIACDTDYNLKKQLYEKMGDGACYLKNFTKGIEYYKKMLEMAELNGEAGKDLSICYISLAQTYHDNKQYQLATQYFKKDYEFCKNSPKEAINSLLLIAQNMALAEMNVDDIILIHKEARLVSKNISDNELKAKVLKNSITFLRKNNKLSDATILETELENLDHALSETESDDTEEHLTPNIGDDIDIDNITDLSDGSDTEKDMEKPRVARTRNKGLVIKKNAKGETQLHIACINGKTALVQKLLDQGHVVNIRDNCGWLPIHEACICGHKQIVEMLLEKGAAINDRGGINCNGMTPLHDASSNGHLEIIELMLDKGASPIATTDDGETPLQLLNIWRNTVELDAIEQTYYETLVNRMMKALEKAGHNKTDLMYLKNNQECNMSRTKISPKNKALIRVNDNASDTVCKAMNKSYKKFERKSASRNNHSVKLGDLRRTVESFDDIEEKKYDNNSDFEILSNYGSSKNSDIESTHSFIESEESCDSVNAADEYKMEIENLRNRANVIEPIKKRKSIHISKRPALLLAEEVGEDWLEDDIGNISKKRKTYLEDKLINTVNVYNKHDNSRSISKTNNKENSYQDNVHEVNDIPEDAFVDDFQDFEELTSYANKRKSQSTLISAGFTRKHSSSPNSLRSNSPVTSVSQNKNTLNISQHKRTSQIKITNFANVVEPDSTTTSTLAENSMVHSVTNIDQTLLNNTIIKQMLSIDVRIEGKLFRVPVPMSDLNILSMKWLADEATKRFYKKEAMKPILELETKTGAMLSEDDLISILFPPGGFQSEEVLGKVTKWNIPSLNDRYKDACTCMNLVFNQDLYELLEGTSMILNITDANFRQQLHPLCKALNRQTNLYELNLSGNFMADRSIEFLCESLPTLQNLTTLNLSLNHLSALSISYISNTLTKSILPILNNLTNLNLSNNPLRDESFKHLAVITRFLKLKSFNLHNVDFTDDIFRYNRNIELCLDYVENFDLSYNNLSTDDIVKFISWIKPRILKDLNVGYNDVREGLCREIVQIFQNGGGVPELKRINFSRSKVTDEEVYELLRILISTDNLEELDLSYNDNITSISLKRILETASPIKLNLNCCKNLPENFDIGLKLTDAPKKCKILQTTLDYVENGKECDILTNLWKNEYQELCGVDGLNKGLLHLYVTDSNELHDF